MADIRFSLYENKEAKENKDFTVENYIGSIKHGTNRNLVEKARAVREAGNIDEYKALKGSSSLITGSCTYESGQPKSMKNIKAMNGLIVLDIDNDQIDEEKYYSVRNDKYTYIIHKSFSGKDYCVFVKIDSSKFQESFEALAEYYLSEFSISVDQACKNPNRLRYMSYDENIFVNEKSVKYVVKNIKRHAPIKEPNYIFHGEDFDYILEQISEKGIDLCQEDYIAYMRIGMSIASKFGASGLETFKVICSYGGKYNDRRTEKDYKGFCENGMNKSTIATFYYFCKQAGLEIYRQRTKDIINRVKVGKSQGTPTVESISSVTKLVHGFEVTDKEKELIQSLINSKNDYSAEANEGTTEIEQLQSYIVDVYEPYMDEITNITYTRGGTPYDETQFNNIYLDCQKSLDFKVSTGDVRAIMNSNAVKRINSLKDFIKDHTGEVTRGHIDSFAECIIPYNAYNVWAFKKWYVGCLHNWTAPHDCDIVSPLTFVLTGQQHGTGKTTMMRNILPASLFKYYNESKLDSKDKDSTFRLATNLIVMDDEFGGQAIKDVKAYKAMSDSNKIDQRRPYERESKTYKRRAGLGGTSNDLEILKDVTGNRRIMPALVEKIDFDKMLSIDKKAMLMEAYTLLNEGFEWAIYSKEDIAYLKENTEHNESGSPAEDIFFNLFSLEQTHEFSKRVIVNQGEILNYVATWSMVKLTKYELSDVYVKNKMQISTHRIDGGKTKKGYALYIKPVQEGY